MNTKQEIEEKIVDTCIKIIKEPLLYFSEADIQQLLTENLRQIKELKKLYKTSVNRGQNSKGIYSTSLIHREYGGGEGRRIDIVILKEDDVKKMDVSLKVENKYPEPDFAFELGTEKTINIQTHFKKDIEKLSRVSDTGYLIHIFKDVTKSPRGTETRDNTENKIDVQFKNVFSKNKITIPTKVKILAFIIRVSRKNQTRIWGKFEIFSGKKWKKINIAKENEISAAILKEIQ